MAATTTALVLESNGVTFFNGNEVLRAGSNVGLTMPIPTPDGGGSFQGDFWASPINDNGIITGITFTPYNLNNGLPAKPHPYSVAVCKIRWQGVNTNGKPDYYFVLGTSTQWAAGSLPTASSLVYWPAIINPQQVVGSDGVVVPNSFEFILGLPTINYSSPILTFFPVGYLNDVALTAATANGYANTTLLLSFLNTNWTTIGSPSISITWSLSPNATSVKGAFTSSASDQLNVENLYVLTAWIFGIL